MFFNSQISLIYSLIFKAAAKQSTQALSILEANKFDKWVITHSVADTNFHGHRPAV